MKEGDRVFIGGRYCIIKRAGVEVSLVQFPNGVQQHISNDRMKQVPDEEKK